MTRTEQAVAVTPRTGDVRERIIDAARRLFASRGYGGTPTKDIATEAGVGTGTVFYHFATKRDLLEAVATERLFSPNIQEVLATPRPTVRETLQSLGERWVGHLDDRAEILSILVNARLETPDVFAEAQRSLIGGLELLTDYLCAELGVEHDAALMASHGLLSSVLVGALIVPSATIDNGDGWIERVVDSVLLGLEPRH